MSPSSVALVTDSTAYIPQDLLEQYHIHVIPQYLIWRDETQLDGVSITPTAFYRRLAASDSIPTTSQPTAGDFVEFFTRLADEADAIVGVFISSQLSGTVNSALAARDMLPDLPIHVVDSQSTSMGLGFMALAAARAAAAGRPLDEVVAAAAQLVPQMNVLFVVETLEYLHKGGRIGGAANLFGSALSIKPILHLQDGRIEPLARVRTKERAVRWLIDRVIGQTTGSRDLHMAIVHADALEEADRLKREIEAQVTCDELLLAELSPVIGTHVGPQTLGVVFHSAGEA